MEEAVSAQANKRFVDKSPAEESKEENNAVNHIGENTIQSSKNGQITSQHLNIKPRVTLQVNDLTSTEARIVRKEVFGDLNVNKNEEI